MSNSSKIKSSVIDVLACKPISKIMSPLRKNNIPIFMLHRMADKKNGITGHCPLLLEQALNYINSHGYSGISIAQLVSDIRSGKEIPSNSVAFTIDDGFKDQAEFALPLFEKHKIPVTLFIPTDFVDDSRLPWDYMIEYLLSETKDGVYNIKLNEVIVEINLTSAHSRRAALHNLYDLFKSWPAADAERALNKLANDIDIILPDSAPKGYLPMTWEEAQRLESKYVQFGPHGRSHFVLTQFDEGRCFNEIQHSWNRLTEKLTNPCPIFCYPTGRPELDFKKRDKALVEKSGLKAALSTEAGYFNITSGQSDLFSMKRFSFPDNMADFKQYCSWLERAKELTIHR